MFIFTQAENIYTVICIRNRWVQFSIDMIGTSHIIRKYIIYMQQLQKINIIIPCRCVSG